MNQCSCVFHRRCYFCVRSCGTDICRKKPTSTSTGSGEGELQWIEYGEKEDMNVDASNLLHADGSNFLFLPDVTLRKKERSTLIVLMYGNNVMTL